jgi:hypothetical protein
MDRDEQRASGQCHAKGQREREERSRAGTGGVEQKGGHIYLCYL